MKNYKNRQYMVLGVALSWSFYKGIDVFAELSNRLGEKYQIVMVGVSESEKALLPDNIITIRRTNDQKELAEIYSAADVFVNPTREDNYPTVNMEAIACGTPVVTFDTGGSAEMVNCGTGIVVSCNDIEAMEQGIRKICENKNNIFGKVATNASHFDRYFRYHEYVDLYQQLN